MQVTGNLCKTTVVDPLSPLNPLLEEAMSKDFYGTYKGNIPLCATETYYDVFEADPNVSPDMCTTIQKIRQIQLPDQPVFLNVWRGMTSYEAGYGDQWGSCVWMKSVDVPPEVGRLVAGKKYYVKMTRYDIIPLSCTGNCKYTHMVHIAGQVMSPVCRCIGNTSQRQIISNLSQTQYQHTTTMPVIPFKPTETRSTKRS